MDLFEEQKTLVLACYSFDDLRDYQTVLLYSNHKHPVIRCVVEELKKSKFLFLELSLASQDKSVVARLEEKELHRISSG
ncbi:MAG: hypothetical protein MHMPM18_002419 [Marteilia pararefringens]